MALGVANLGLFSNTRINALFWLPCVDVQNGRWDGNAWCDGLEDERSTAGEMEVTGVFGVPEWLNGGTHHFQPRRPDRGLWESGRNSFLLILRVFKKVGMGVPVFKEGSGRAARFPVPQKNLSEHLSIRPFSAFSRVFIDTRAAKHHVCRYQRNRSTRQKGEVSKEDSKGRPWVCPGGHQRKLG